MIRISASTLGSARACFRKWAFDIRGNGQGTRSQALGTEVHAQIEHWINEKRPLQTSLEAGQIALAGADLWPKDGLAEVEWTYTLEGIRFDGRIDLLSPSELFDHKTTKDFKWAKTPEQLHEDLQANLYGYATGFDPIPCTWIYYRTKPPYRRHVVRTTITRKDAERKVLEQLPLARAMLQHEYTDPMKLPYNPSACQDYGGCPYQNVCRITFEERLFNMSNSQTAVQDAYNQLLASQQQAPAPAQFQQAPAFAPVAAHPRHQGSPEPVAAPPGYPVAPTGFYYCQVNGQLQLCPYADNQGTAAGLYPAPAPVATPAPAPAAINAPNPFAAAFPAALALQAVRGDLAAVEARTAAAAEPADEASPVSRKAFMTAWNKVGKCLGDKLFPS